MTKNPFCGFKCYAAWQSQNRLGVGRKRIQVDCYTCGTTIEKQPNAVSDKNFCSRKCFAQWRSSDDWTGSNNPAWLGGHSTYRGPNWRRQSRAARLRDANTCQCCGLTKTNLPVHHVRPFRLFEDYREANDLANLLTLCPSCHSKAESTFWRENPDLAEMNPFRPVIPVIACKKCGVDFVPRSGPGKTCDACCTRTCDHCGTAFYSRKAAIRPTKYCSRACRNASVKLQANARQIEASHSPG